MQPRLSPTKIGEVPRNIRFHFCADKVWAIASEKNLDFATLPTSEWLTARRDAFTIGRMYRIDRWELRNPAIV